ncbi:MAG: hypothetical protein WC980_01375 [Candidatus Brocadiia bacterium]
MRYGMILALTAFFAGWLYAAAENADSDRDTEKIERLIEELDRELKPAPVQEQVKPTEILQKVAEKMARAEDYLSRSSVYGPKNPLPGNDQSQSEAIKEINRLLNKTESSQKEAIEDIDRLIKSAPETMMPPPPSGKGGKPKPNQSQKKDQSQPKERDKGKPKPGEQMQQPQPLRETPKEQPQPKGPAERAYEAKGGLPEGMLERRGTTYKWGNLPPKMRDEIIQNEQEGFLPDYEDWLKQYFKTLAED